MLWVAGNIDAGAGKYPGATAEKCVLYALRQQFGLTAALAVFRGSCGKIEPSRSATKIQGAGCRDLAVDEGTENLPVGQSW